MIWSLAYRRSELRMKERKCDWPLCDAKDTCRGFNLSSWRAQAYMHEFVRSQGKDMNWELADEIVEDVNASAPKDEAS